MSMRSRATSPSGLKVTPVHRVDRSEFRVSRMAGEPRVVVGNVSDWGALHRWQPDYLKSVIGDCVVAVREAKGPPRNIFQNLAEGGRIPFDQYLDWVLATARDLDQIALKYDDPGDITRAVCASGFDYSYYLDAKLGRLSETLLDDAPAPDWYRTEPLDTNLWCGVLGTSSGLHCDVTPNCNVQVIGTKHFTLFPPAQSRLIYQFRGGTHCLFDPNVPDFETFPLARDASGWECTLRPGESLYIPVGWYHQVTVTSSWALNVNFFWRRPFPQGLAIPVLWQFFLRRARAKAVRTVRSVL